MTWCYSNMMSDNLDVIGDYKKMVDGFQERLVRGETFLREMVSDGEASEARIRADELRAQLNNNQE